MRLKESASERHHGLNMYACGGMSVSQNPQWSPYSSMLDPLIAMQTVEAEETRLEEMQKRKAKAAMMEFLSMVHSKEPLWLTSPDPDGSDYSVEKLNKEEYYRLFHGRIELESPSYKIEGTRATAVVFTNPNNLVNKLMDVNKWSRLFPSMISRAVVTKVLSAGEEGNYNETLQVMSVDYRLPSPMLQINASALRYCIKLSDKSWAIVNISMDSIDPNLKTSYKIRPSGCLIIPQPPEHSKIIWIEHLEVEMGQVYQYFLNYSLAFGAKRWVEGLDRQFDRGKSVMMHSTFLIADSVYTIGAYKLQELSAKLDENYCSGATGAAADGWQSVPGQFGSVKVISRRYTEVGRPFRIIINASTFCWLPVAPKTIYNFLTDNTQRFKWDILSNGRDFEEIAHISCGVHNAKTISLLRFKDINSEGNMTPRKLLLQEAVLNHTCGYVMYAPFPMELANSSVNADELVKRAQFVASGVALIPRGHPVLEGHRLPAGDGCITKVMVQIVQYSGWRSRVQPESIDRVQNLVLDTMKKLKNHIFGWS